MTPELYAKEIDAELRMIYEKYDYDFKMLQSSLDSESTILAMMEAGNEKEGVIAKLIRKLREFLQTITNQIKKIVFGAKIAPGQENAQIRLEKDPNILVKFLNGDIKDSKEYLRKARNGEIGVDEAKAFVEKQDGGFANIKGAILPAAATLAFCVGKQKFFDQWKADALDMFKTSEQSSTNSYADKVSNLMGSENKRNQAKEGAEMILLNHTQQTTKRLSDMIIGPVKSMYQKGVLKNKIMEDAERRNTKQGRREITKEKKSEAKQLDKMTKTTLTAKQKRDAFRGTEKSLNRGIAGAKASFNAALNKSYLDVDAPVDKEAIKNRKKL